MFLSPFPANVLHNDFTGTQRAVRIRVDVVHDNRDSDYNSGVSDTSVSRSSQPPVYDEKDDGFMADEQKGFAL